MDPTAEFAQLQLDFVDQVQWRYELIRPLVLLADGTATQRAQDTHTHPDTVRRLIRRFQQQGMLRLLPNDVSGARQGRTPRVPEAVRHEIDQLKALYAGFHARELARIVFCKLGYHIDHKTVQKLWQQSPVVTQDTSAVAAVLSPSRPLPGPPAGDQTLLSRLGKVSINRFLHMSRTTIDRVDRAIRDRAVCRAPGPQTWPQGATRKVWLPRMVQVYRLQKAHPDAGEFRIWSLLAQPDISVRTVGRIMALNKLVYDDIPHMPKKGVKKPPGPHPYKAQHRHEYWFIDGRRMDFAMDGVKWWSLMILDGYSRTMLAGAMAPTEATWVALMVLYTACVRYGAPEYLVSDSGGAYTSNDFEAVCTRLQIQHETIVSTQGESYQNLMETHFNIQRRLYDYQFSLARTPAAFDQCHQAFIQTYNTTAHQGLLKDRQLPPIPIEVLGEAKGRRYAPDELARHFSHALFPRTTNRHGCVTLHSYHFYIEAGLPHTQVLLWVSGEQLRAMFEGVRVSGVSLPL